MARVLIAGCGYVGSALAARLAANGEDVVALSRNPRGDLAGVTPLSADLRDRTTLDSLGGRFDWVVYTASPDERTDDAYRSAYVDGVRNVIEATADDPPAVFLMTSSTGVYAQEGGEWIDEQSPTEPTDFSGRRLLEGERLVLELTGGVVLRLGGIYGPGRRRLLDSVLRGEATYTTEERYTNRIHRDDCARAIEHLLSHRERFQESLYLGVDDEPASMRTVVEWIAARTGAPRPRCTAQQPAGPTSTGRPQRGNKRCRNGRLRATGFELSFPTFREGYSDLLDRQAR